MEHIYIYVYTYTYTYMIDLYKEHMGFSEYMLRYGIMLSPDEQKPCFIRGVPQYNPL